MVDKAEYGKSDVIVRNIVEEESSNPTEERSIDSRNGSPNIAPLFALIVWNRRVSMVEIREHDDPGIAKLRQDSE